MAGSIPALFMLAASLPAVGWTCPPVPLSHMMILPPLLTTITVNGIDTKSAGRPAFVIAAFTSSTEALEMKAGSCGFSQMPS